MKLHYKEIGVDGTPLLLCHGLYGSSDNWVPTARSLSQSFRVIVPDLRNHGLSPHSSESSYFDMASDLVELINFLNLETVFVVGHSMGGKVAMALALLYPQLVSRLVVLDIAPKSYVGHSNYAVSTNNHSLIIESLLAIPLDQCASRDAIENCLAPSVEDKAIRQFLLKNIFRKNDGTFAWKLNLLSLQQNLNIIMDGFSNTTLADKVFSKPTVFIRGEQSAYIQDEDMLGIRRFFSTAELVTIPKAGHWLHAEQPELVTKTIAYFLAD